MKMILWEVDELKSKFYSYYAGIFLNIFIFAGLFTALEEFLEKNDIFSIVFIMLFWIIQVFFVVLILRVVYRTSRKMNKNPIIMCLGAFFFHIFFAILFVSAYRRHKEKLAM